MNSRTFLMSSALSFLFLMLAYVLIVDKVVLAKREIPFPYREYLLEASAEVRGKVIIESGSNALHGLDAKALSNYFAAPVLIVSDVAAYPLRKKLLRFESLLGAGDVLILPLEWDFYSANDTLPKSFLDNVADEERHLAHYVDRLSLVERVRFILTEFPLRNTVEALSLERDPIAVQKAAYRRTVNFERILLRRDNTSYGGTERDGPEEMGFAARQKGTCDRYLFHRAHGVSLEVSSTFRDNLELLKKIRSRGVSVFFTWPAVVDSEDSRCYSDTRMADGLDGYVSEIRSMLDAEGFAMLGSYRMNRFPAECFLNTYYHVRWSCAADRTGMMIADFEAAGVGPLKNSIDLERFEALVQARLKERQQRLRPW